jgi:hypothetical protein
MSFNEPRPTDCIVLRYPDGEREYRIAERLPIKGATISRNGSKYVVLDVHPEEAGSVVTLGLIESSADAAT